MKTKTFTLILLSGILMYSTTALSQFNVLNRVKNAVDNRISNQVDKTIDQGLDSIQNKNTKKKTTNNSTGDQKINQNPENSASEENVKADKSSSFQSYSKFDFIPGEKVIFYEDFSQDAIGDFPALWNTNASAEVVNTNMLPGNWMKYNISESIWTDKLLKLPENYTLEFDVIPTSGKEFAMAQWGFRLYKCTNEKSWDGGAVPGMAGFAFGVEYFGRPYYRAYNNSLNGEFWDQKGNADEEKYYQKKDQKYHMSFWIQKTRVRVYQNETKIFDVPRAIPDQALKFDRIRFEEEAALVSNIRIAVGAPDTRNKLMNEGKLVSYGIYFDVNKDVVKPESYGTLKEIASILNEVPDVKVKIVGHTDADGADALNLDLSKRRAASVKTELTKSFNVNADRLVTDGMGESQPLAPNDTPVNKALNRRVEFIKL